jgi:hypothetical protein
VLSLGLCWGTLHLRGAHPVLARLVLGMTIAFALALAGRAMDRVFGHDPI